MKFSHSSKFLSVFKEEPRHRFALESSRYFDKIIGSGTVKIALFG